MEKLLSNIKGDKALWAIISLLALFSFVPVYSASSNLAYLYGNGNTIKFLFKHLVHLGLGFVILYFVHKFSYKYFKALSIVALPLIAILLLFTLLKGSVISGANASRWIRVPVVGISLQPSTLALVVLMTYVSFYMSSLVGKVYSLKATLVKLWLPVLIVVGLIFPANLSTAALIFIMVVLLVFLGGYPIKYLALIGCVSLIFLAIFYLTVKAFPDAFPNRLDTWISRVENFVSEEEGGDENYQVERAKIAIATGGISGRGPGKSIQRNFLPQSSSDFIYAIIIEEYGLIGGLFLLFLYLFIFVRFLVISNRCTDVFGKLLVLGLGFPIVFQALINMGVAVELFPVTGQTLPLISSGGTSIWMTCLALGMILSVSAKNENKTKLKEKEINPLDVLSQAQ